MKIDKEKVAPRAGAWVETVHEVEVEPGVYGRTRAGAWVETYYYLDVNIMRRTPCGCVG